MARHSESELQKKVEASRKERNKDLILRMQRKEALWSYDSQASWFPPRPIVKKDMDHVRELYGEILEPSVKPEAKQEEQQPPVRDKGVVINLAKRRKKD